MTVAGNSNRIKLGREVVYKIEIRVVLIVHEEVPNKLHWVFPLESFRVNDNSLVSVKISKLSDKVGGREVTVDSWLIDAAS